jgi:hypothetical protein
MRIRSRHLALTAALLTTSCTTPPFTLDAFRAAVCNGGVCKAWVTVIDCATGQLPVTPDPIPVPGTNNIEWTIDTPGYLFPADGIVIHAPGFTDGHVTGNGRKYVVHDQAGPGSYKYTVKVVRESDQVGCRPSDPFILNR